MLLDILSAGKSSVLMDVKPWDDETDMKKLEEAVRSVQMDGLLWGACMCSLLFWYYVAILMFKVDYVLRNILLYVCSKVGTSRVRYQEASDHVDYC